MLKIENLSVKLGNFSFKRLTFSVNKGEYFVILGMSGSGKSILLQLISGLIVPGEGKIYLNKRDITNEKIDKREVGIVFQDSALFPHMTVSGNIGYPLNGRIKGKANIIRRVKDLASITKVSHLLTRYPENLSGGEKQRVALARTLATNPQLLLLDEPLSALDAQLRSDLRALLRDINKMGITVLHVTHDYEEAAILASRIGVIENGELTQTGTPGQLFKNPSSQFIARFVGIKNFFNGELTGNINSLRKFTTSNIHFSLYSDEPEGEGAVVIRAEDIFVSLTGGISSVQNQFEGVVTRLVPAVHGVELFIDIGVELAVLVTDEAVRNLELKGGKKVFVSFKASAIKYVGK